MRKNSPNYLSLVFLLLLLVLLPLLYIGAREAQNILTQALGTKANIVVDTTNRLEPIIPFWNAYSQGGEESGNMIAPVVSKVSALAPRLIRIDHLYDHHHVVGRNDNGQLTFDFTSLDGVVRSILETGAQPFFALSYMPPAISSGDITDAPHDWNEWALVVQRTIERYSGKSGMNLTDIYYEVWNEPDLFGNWKYYGDKNYLTMYTYAVRGATNASNTNSFRIGGPSTTQLYKNWIVALADHVTENDLRLDFVSWHRYTTDPRKYAQDTVEVTSWLFPYPHLVTIPRLVTEWGFDSNIHPGYDTSLAAAHTAAAVRQAINGYEALFAFEVVDGPDPAGKTYWGRWGLLTHPKTGALIKPRYHVFGLLDQLQGERLLLTGEGTWVTGLATRNDTSIKVLLTNYDLQGRNNETVPITFKNLARGEYEFIQTYLGKEPTQELLTLSEDTFSTSVIMTANSVLLLELTPIIDNPFFQTSGN